MAEFETLRIDRSAHEAINSTVTRHLHIGVTKDGAGIEQKFAGHCFFMGQCMKRIAVFAAATLAVSGAAHSDDGQACRARYGAPNGALAQCLKIAVFGADIQACRTQHGSPNTNLARCIKIGIAAALAEDEMKLCHDTYGVYAAGGGDEAELARCIKIGGRSAMEAADKVARREELERTRLREVLAAQEAQRLAAEERARADAAAAAAAVERVRAEAAAQQEARAAAAKWAARTASEVARDNEIRERQEQQALAEQERRRAVAIASIPQIRDGALATVRSMHRDPDSVRFSDVRVVTDQHGELIAVCGHASGTNGYGARVSGPWLFSAQSDHVYIKGPGGWGDNAGLSLWSQHCR